MRRTLNGTNHHGRRSARVEHCGDNAYVTMDGEEVSAVTDPDKSPKGHFKVIGHRIVEIAPVRKKSRKARKKGAS